jgi:hypothetical protein
LVCGLLLVASRQRDQLRSRFVNRDVGLEARHGADEVPAAVRVRPLNCCGVKMSATRSGFGPMCR